MLLLSAEKIRKHYGPDPVLDGVTLEIRQGHKIGLVGPNGAGKTTLLRILAGADEPDGGQVTRRGSLRVGYLEQHPEFSPAATIWDVAADGLAELAQMAAEADRVAEQLASADDDQRRRLGERFDYLQHQLQQHQAWHLEHRVERVLEGLGFCESRFSDAAGCLSGGEQNRLLLARLLLSEPDLLLLDEPSNHLDMPATQWLERYLAEVDAALLIVSHDRYLLDKATDRTFELLAGTVDAYPGSFSAYWRLKAERLKVQQRTYARQQELVAKTEDFIRRNQYGQKHAQAQDRRKKLERIERVELPRQIAAPRFAFPSVARSGDVVLSLKGLVKGYGRALFEELSLDVLRGQRWGVLGPNGCGKTTLLRLIIGDETPDAGRVVRGHGVRVGYFDQLLRGLDPAQSAIDAVRPADREFPEPARRDLLACFGLKGDAVFQPIASLSGGERNRTALARLAAAEANLLVLDEPTNHLDLWARDALEQALSEFDGSVVFVSHDRYFINRVADHLLVHAGGRFRVVDGNYETYLHLTQRGLFAGIGETEKRAAAAVSAAQGGSTRAPARGEPASPRRKRRFPYRKLDELEREIFDREAKAAELEAQLSRPDVLRDGQRVRELQSAIAQEKQRLGALYEHWEEAAELN